ncbi:Hypothetical_protein [Hexamita inflata]|uniref:Hypothetical_protein n=1 Tax=Hexamita inflata TaxID=28002 RepID=A0AA86N5L6_9EUKA|nr:Hypothetical protein HINF_LOCUS952 [Hexamita inflata]
MQQSINANNSTIGEIVQAAISSVENTIMLELDGEIKYISVKRNLNDTDMQDLQSSNSILEFQKPKQVTKLSQLNFRVTKPDLTFQKDSDQSTNIFSEFSLFK